MENFYAWAFLGSRVLLGGSLILFLWFAFLRLSNSLTRDFSLLTIRDEPAIRFEILEGYPQKSEKITTSHFYIGRDPICEYIIDHETISAQHAIVSYHHNQWWVEDAGSRNGTFINDLAIEQETVLTNHDILRCGSVKIKLIIEK